MQDMWKFREMAKRESKPFETEFDVSWSIPRSVFICISFPLDPVEELLSPGVEGLGEDTDVLH